MNFISILTASICLIIVDPATKSNVTKTSFNKFDEANQKIISKNVIESLAKEDFNNVQKKFHIKLKSMLTTEKISESWATYIQTMGAFEKVLSSKLIVYEGINIIRCRCQFAQGNGNVEVSFDEDDKIIGLYLK